MKIKANFKYTGFTPKAPVRKINDARRQSYQELGDHFYATNLPRRFTFFGSRLLRYQPRTQKYKKRKQKEGREAGPFIYSGTTRDRVLSSLTRVTARATSRNSHVKLTLNAPALNLRANASSPNLREEITRVADREIGPLERVLFKSLDSNFNKLEAS